MSEGPAPTARPLRPMRHRWRHFGERDVRCQRRGCTVRKRFKPVGRDSFVCTTANRGCRLKAVVR